MAVAQTVDLTAFFPEGTSVAAYPAWGNGLPPAWGTSPVGSATQTVTVTSGQAVFTSLAAETDYYVAGQVSSSYRYVRISTKLGPSASLGGDPKAPTAAPGDADTSIATTGFDAAAIAAHAALKTGTHGIPSMSAGQVPVWNGSAWIATDVATQAEMDAKPIARRLGYATRATNLLTIGSTITAVPSCTITITAPASGIIGLRGNAAWGTPNTVGGIPTALLMDSGLVTTYWSTVMRATTAGYALGLSLMEAHVSGLTPGNSYSYSLAVQCQVAGTADFAAPFFITAFEIVV